MIIRTYIPLKKYFKSIKQNTSNNSQENAGSFGSGKTFGTVNVLSILDFDVQFHPAS